MAGSISKFCDRMRYWCDEGNLGYDQSNRWDIRYGGECDCSSLVIFALKEAGFDTGSASYTGNMSDQLCARGWKRIANNGNPQKGDILLHDTNHVAVWLGDCLAQASIDENGRATGGAAGDQTGRETRTGGYYNYPWNCYLRYTGAQLDSKTANAGHSNWNRFARDLKKVSKWSWLWQKSAWCCEFVSACTAEACDWDVRKTERLLGGSAEMSCNRLWDQMRKAGKTVFRRGNGVPKKGDFCFCNTKRLSVGEYKESTMGTSDSWRRSRAAISTPSRETAPTW